MNFRSALVFPSLTLCLFAFSGACGGDSNNGPKGGSGGSGGRGGSGGMTGSTGGMTGSTGGMTGSTGGMGGSTGGMGGAPKEPPKPIGEFPFFSGKTDKVTKLSPDLNEGYFYSSKESTPKPTPAVPNPVKIPAIPNSVVKLDTDPTLPSGTEYAYKFEVPRQYPDTVVIGWNWVANKSDTEFQWYDASEFAGFAFWAKTTYPNYGPSVYIYDRASLSKTLFGGDCMDGANGEPGSCPSLSQLNGNPAIKSREGWTRVVARFTDFAPGPTGVGAFKWDPKLFGRVDLIILPPTNAEPFEVLITGVELLKEAQLPAPKPLE